jgi:hypothetical protein
MRIAICYWGLTRSTKKVYQTHHDRLFKPLKDAGVAFDVYMHSWRTVAPMVWWTPAPEPDYEEYKLLTPTHYQIDDQEAYLATLDMAKYFDADLWARVGDSHAGEWVPQLIRNHLCALESQKRAFAMIEESDYDFVMFVRPDVEIVTAIDLSWLAAPFSILLPSINQGEGLNDQFAIVPFKSAAHYARRIDEIAAFRQTEGRIVSEKYVKFIVHKYYEPLGPVTTVPFMYNIIRP